jgi:membrane-bound lytic murein transglycosylase D
MHRRATERHSPKTVQVRWLSRCGFASVLAVAGVSIITLTGCGGAAQHSVAVHTIQISPPPAAVFGPLPLNPARARGLQLALTPPDGIERLAAQVQAVFAAGQQVSASQPDAARQQYQNAQNLLKASGFDASAEPSLAALNSRIETALAQTTEGGVASADGSVVEPPEPASPIEEVAAAGPDEGLPDAPLDPKLRSNAEGEVAAVRHDLPLTVNDTVLSFLNYFQTPHGRAIVETGLRRAGRYRPMIERVLREEGLPSDLMYMAQAESAFQPQALSRAGARGLWQFMSYRGKQYGLDHSFWVDDRQDPEKATRAAAHHLRDLYGLFGDWYLVMAAYNAGPGSVQKAIEHTGYADFWELYKLNALPKETRNYVPIILALTLIAKDPARYGMDVDPDAPPPVESVQLSHPVDLRLVAETLDVDLDELRALNPQLLRLVTPADPKFVLSVPAGTADDFNAQMASIPPDKWTLWRRHRVEEGETLSGIARKYNVKAADLLEVNGLDSPASLDPGTKLIVPISAQAQPAAGRLVRYRVHGNDTLATVADEFDVSTTELKKWNNLRTDRVPVGTHLRIYPGGLTPPPEVAQKPASNPATMAEWRAAPKPAGSTAREAVTHRVQNGETLYSIARAYQTTVDALRKGNEFLFSRPLQAGDTLTILPAR